MVCAMITVLGVLVLPAVFLTLQFDGAGWNWSLVLLPVWILDAPVVLSSLAACLKPPMMDPDDPTPGADLKKQHLVMRLYLTGHVCLVLAQQVLLVLKLNGSATLGWAVALSPWFALEGLWLLHALYKLAEALRAAPGEESEKRVGERPLRLLRRLRQVVLYACRCCLAVSVALAAAAAGPSDWWAALTPAWVYLALAALFALREIKLSTAIYREQVRGSLTAL
jgi:hypothetical protein